MQRHCHTFGRQGLDECDNEGRTLSRGLVLLRAHAAEPFANARQAHVDAPRHDLFTKQPQELLSDARVLQTPGLTIAQRTFVQAVQGQEAKPADLCRQLPLANPYFHEVKSGRRSRTHELEALLRLLAQPVVQLGLRKCPDAAPLLQRLLHHAHGHFNFFLSPSPAGLVQLPRRGV